MASHMDEDQVNRTGAPIHAGPSCSRCGNQLYPDDRACPNCGQAIPGQGPAKGWGGLALAGIVLVAAGIAVAFGLVRLLGSGRAPTAQSQRLPVQAGQSSRPPSSPYAQPSYDEGIREPTVPIASFDNVARGMSLEEVNAVLEMPGRKAISMGSGSHEKAKYKWEWDSGTVVEGAFEGGRLVRLSVDGTPQALAENGPEQETAPIKADLWVPAEN